MKKENMIKKFASNIAVSFFFAALFVVIFYFFLENSTSSYVSLINTAAVRDADEEKIATYNFDAKRLINYPKYGSKYATLEIEKAKIKLPVYLGDTKKILRLGVGHYYGSYFPGELGTIIYAAHNNPGYFQNLGKVKIGDIAIVNASYGTFKYKVFETKVVKETDVDEFDIQSDKEILLMYTCWPIDRNLIGRKRERLIVLAERIGEINEEK